MKLLLLTSLLTFGLTGCVAEKHDNSSSNGIKDNIHHKRINTTECKDSDDWYLDGYRVGKSFAKQKQTMLENRMTYCHFTAQTLPKSYKQNWETGFNVGYKH